MNKKQAKGRSDDRVDVLGELQKLYRAQVRRIQIGMGAEEASGCLRPDTVAAFDSAESLLLRIHEIRLLEGR